jgi:hypothetical protein
MMEAVSTSETSVNFYEITRHNIPEDNYVHCDEPDVDKSKSIKAPKETYVSV